MSSPQPNHPNLTAQLTGRLATLVAARTLTSAPAVSAEPLAQLASELKTNGLTVVTGAQGGFPYLYVHLQPLADTQLWLYAHVDVVPGNPTQFTLQSHGSRLYGRGAYDMKFAIAVYLQLCADLAASKPPIGLIITSDEEATGEYGAGYLASRLQLAGKTIIMPDGGAPWSIEAAAKGLVWVRLEATGQAAHASRIDLGTSAIEKILAAVASIKAKLHAGTGQTFSDTTVNIGHIEGGEAINQVAPHASVELDIRFAAPTTPRQIEHALKEVAQTAELQLTTWGHTAAISHHLDHPDTQRLRTIMSQRTKHSVPFVRSYGATDAQYFTQAGTNTIVFYPKGGGHHSASEYITRRSLHQMYDILHQFITEDLPR